MRLAAFLLLPYLAVGAAFFGVAVVYPRYRLSQYRYELWRIRDELLDEVADGTIEDLDAAAGALDVLEALIVSAPNMTLRYGLACMWALRHELPTVRSARLVDDEIVMETAGLAAALDPRVRVHVLAARDAGVRQLGHSSVSAHLFGIAALTMRPVLRVAPPLGTMGRNTIGRELVESMASPTTGRRPVDILSCA